MTPRLAVFDCDGTLVDGQAGICEAMEAGFTAAQLPPPDRHAIRRIVGLSLPQAVRFLAPAEDDRARATVVDGYKHAFRASRDEGRLHEPLFDGIDALLTALLEDGWLLAVATGKSDRGLASCLDALGLGDMFVSLQTADRHPSKPDPAMLDAAIAEAGADAARTVMIGDTSFDMIMARAAGTHAIGVDWGYHTPEELLAEGAQGVCETPAQLGRTMMDMFR